MKKIILVIAFSLGLVSVQAQTVEELKAQKAEKEAAAATLQEEAAALQAQIDTFPGWKFGAFGTIGANISGYNDWFSRDAANNSAGNIGIVFNGLANLDREQYFWRNGLNVNLGWVKNDNKDIDTDSDSFDPSSDIFTINSLFGYKLSEKLAVSTLGEYRTTFLENFNDPGYLDLGVGITWLPIQNMTVVAHPLNYNFVFAKNDAAFESSLGAKVMVDYFRNFGALSYKTNLSSFLSYKSGNLSNWTWINSFGYTLWKGIGLGFDFGLRQNHQEALNFAQKGITNPDSIGFDDVDNKLQTYWLFGLNYNF